MALISCPNCGQSISDKAFICPHCKQQNGNIPVINTTCSECGTQYNREQNFCPTCGYSNSISTPKKKSRKCIIITAVILSIVIVFGLLGAFIINKGKTAIYYDNLETVTYKMLDGAANAETAGNLIKNVWYNTIYEKRDTTTDKYTMKSGRFVEDFNDALGNLFSDEEFQKNISEIQDNQDEVTFYLKQLKNPPKEYEEAYTVLKTYYESYLSMTKMVINPTGSLQSFSDDFNNLDTETVDAYEKMKLYLN